MQRTGRGCLNRVEAIIHIMGHFITGCRVRWVEPPTAYLICRATDELRRPVRVIIEDDTDYTIIAGWRWLAETDER